MLVSWLNMKLRDQYDSLDQMCIRDRAISHILADIRQNISALEQAVKRAQESEADIYTVSCLWRDEVRYWMEELRSNVDLLEENIDAKYWPLPTYIDLMFGV